MLHTFILAFRSNLIIILVITSGLLFRLINIGQPLLEFFPERQTQTAEITRNIYANGWPDFWTPKIRYATSTPRPLVLELPLYNAVVSFFYGTFSPNFIFGRFVSLISFLVAAIMFVLLLRKTLGEKYIVAPLLFFVFSPVHVLTSRSFQPDEMALMLLLASFYYNSFIFLTLSGLIKTPYYLFGLIIVFRSKKAVLKRLILFLFFSVPILAWGIRASLIMKGETYGGNYSSSNWFDPKAFFDLNWYFSLIQIIHINTLTTLGLLFLIIGLFKYWFDRQFAFWRLYLIIGVFYILLFNRHIVSHEYYSLVLVPPLAVYVGLGLKDVLSIITTKNILIERIAKTLVIAIFVVGLIAPSITKILSGPTGVAKGSPLYQRYINLLDVK